MHSIYLKEGREKSVLRRHPWIFSGAIRRVDGAPECGETVAVRSADGTFLAHGAITRAQYDRSLNCLIEKMGIGDTSPKLRNEEG